MERREGPLNNSEKRQITALKVELARVRAEADAAIEQQTILTSELAHRARNMLTVIQAIILHSLNPDVTIYEARAVLLGRISALARANTLLSDTEWQPMQLSDAIHNALPNLDQYAGRFDIQGPAVAIGPKAAMALTLALHELETNAIKYERCPIDRDPSMCTGKSWSREPSG